MPALQLGRDACAHAPDRHPVRRLDLSGQAMASCRHGVPVAYHQRHFHHRRLRLVSVTMLLGMATAVAAAPLQGQTDAPTRSIDERVTSALPARLLIR